MRRALAPEGDDLDLSQFEGHAAKHALLLAENTRFETYGHSPVRQVNEELTVLKGHGFSRAATATK